MWASRQASQVARAQVARSFGGPVQRHIEQKLSELRPLHLEVANESHGRKSDESHFHVLVVSKAFDGLKPLERHRLVNGLFTEDGSLKFHSLRITAKTPAMWEEDKSTSARPKCTGRGDGNGKATDTTTL
ncbi:unnamed protein product [Effrenium voratum]|nr:unnamed protein product [Effrenium voratum]